MTNIILLFASMSGNTEEMAATIENQLKSNGFPVSSFQIDVDEIEVEDLLKYDAILFGTYTWGDGDVPYELEDFFEDLGEVDLGGKEVALFGSCDSLYPIYGGAVDKFEKQFTDCGATVILPSLKVELTPNEEDAQSCRQFAESFIKHLKDAKEL
ncbi:flavodoxin [Halobacillus andaensis]|uniref:Flavodoxin n=1 Tax=Halobacillus andaensis TaxID=1176239 RepID=A0A917B788_HALAA|nr:flavodoxin [Halobacillus andaensis]MBP2005645.1 flavodoxin I [Halobacillus andaensis]GGF27094.1 flavodoxin [Halobacillus andaensis]